MTGDAHAAPRARGARRPRALLLDLDGTLVDSSPTHAAAFRDALGALAPSAAVGFDYERIRGLPTYDALARLGLLDPALVARVAAAKSARYRDLVRAGAVGAAAGASELLDALASAGVSAIVLTAASRASAELALAGAGLAAGVHALVSADDLALPKPAVEAYVETLGRFGLAAADAVAVDDDATAVRAARAAGLDAVQVGGPAPSDGGWHVASLVGLLSWFEATR